MNRRRVLGTLQRWLGDEWTRDRGPVEPAGEAVARAAPPPPPPSDSWGLERGCSPQRGRFTGDCGVYMLSTARRLAEGRPLDYAEANIPPRDSGPQKLVLLSQKCLRL